MRDALVGDPRQYSAVGILRDGSSILIRAIRADDKERLRGHFSRLSAESVYYRFFRAKKRLTDDELAQFTELDFADSAALVATLGQGAEERFIGVSRYVVLDSASEARRRAEVAFAVTDDYQGRGVGTLLLEHLARIARANGIAELVADVLGDNTRMLAVFTQSGFLTRRSVQDGVVHVSFPTAETERFLEVSLQRERLAAAQSVRAFLNPRSVAVVGASRHPGTIGAALLANVKRYGFRGPIYPVHPECSELDGLHAYPSIGAIGAPVDLAVVAVPAAAVEAVVAECAQAQVHGVVVISAGFAEMSAAGRAAQDRLKDLVRASGMRLVGPNCMGVLNTDPAVSLNATFAPVWPPAGNIGMLTQSGALGLAILDYVRALNVGISTFVSAGNKADVSSNDLLCYWADDPQTQVIVLYLESFGNPRKFARIAPQVARIKPIVAVKSGRSAAGTRAASSHSAALASLDVAVDALFEQAGVIRTGTLEELFDVASLLATQPVPAGRRVGVVTNAGGPGILFADACEARGLELPELDETTVRTLRGFLPPQAGLGNPVDMIASATPEDYTRTIAAVGDSAVIDAVVVIYVPPLVSRPEDIAAAIAGGAGAVPTHKPVLTVFLSSKGAPDILGTGPRGRLPSYSFPENAAQALAAVERYGRWRNRQHGAVFTFGRETEEAIRAVVERLCGTVTGPLWVPPADLAAVLAAAGIPVAAALSTTPEDAVTAAESLGYPLVAKIISADIMHKSDVGGVIMGLESPAAVVAATQVLAGRARAAGACLEGILLQRQVEGGIEALVGVTTDPTFGPLVVCGLGGVLVELVRDAAFRLTPVSDVDAAEMVEKLRTARLLDGYRGRPAGDRKALCDVIMRVSALVELVPELREMDLNPVKILPPGQGAMVVDARMRIGPPR